MTDLPTKVSAAAKSIFDPDKNTQVLILAIEQEPDGERHSIGVIPPDVDAAIKMAEAFIDLLEEQKRREQVFSAQNPQAAKPN